MGSDRRDMPPKRTAASWAVGNGAVPARTVPVRPVQAQTVPGQNRAKPGMKATKAPQRLLKPQQPVAGKNPQPIAKKISSRSPYAMLGAIALLALSAGGVVWFGWFGVQLIVNPQSQLWINRFLPGWIAPPTTGLKPPQTLAQLRAAMTLAGRTMGEPVLLGKNKSLLDGKSTVTDWLIPIQARSPACQSDCDRLVELQVYQSLPASTQTNTLESQLQLVYQQAISGPEELVAIAPLVDAGLAEPGTDRALPLTTVTVFEGNAPKPGVWLSLSGQWVRGDTTLNYGKVIRYNPSQLHLGVMLTWSGTTAQPPLWKAIAGSKQPALVVDQTVGMEPQIQIYQVKARNFQPNPVRLEAISLESPALPGEVYRKALLLARSGLWSTSWQWLQSLQQQQKAARKPLPALAQAQIELVRQHALTTKSQSEQTWASVSQQILANLIDGRWERALQLLEANPEMGRETMALLKADAKRLEQRLAAALEIDPTQPAATAWSALLMSVHQGQPAAIAWLRQQPQSTTADVARVSALLKRLNN